jgi:hypothetical protein
MATMKLVAAVALIAVFQTAPLVPQKPINQTEANENPATSPNSNPDTNNSPITKDDGQAQNPGVSQPYVRISQIYGVPVRENGIDWRLWVFNGLLVIVGGFQVWLLYRTLGAIKRQADIMDVQARATETGANAARNSALALIASERAWVMVDLEKVPTIGLIVTGTRVDGSHDTQVRIRCICSNQGKTPAKVIEKRACLVITTPNQPLSQDPILDIRIIDTSPHYLQSGQSSIHDWRIDSEGQVEFGDMIIIYGVIKYRHIISDREVQTTFGYRITPSCELVRLENYPKYNKNT